MERITITITNWRKWNPRADYKHPTWFAMSNSLLDDSDFADFKPLEFHALVYIFSEASKRNSPTVDLVFAHAKKRNIDAKLLLACVTKLEKVCIVTRSVQNPTESDGIRSLQEDRQTGNTGRQEESERSISSELGLADSNASAMVDPYFKKIKPEVVAGWLDTYQDPDWILHELKKAVNWANENPSRAPKSAFGTYFGNWLRRGFEFARKNKQERGALESKPTSVGIDYAQLTNHLYAALKQFGAYDSDERKAAIVGEHWDWVSRTGIFRKIREQPDNDWNRKAIARELKDAYEARTSQKAGA